MESTGSNAAAADSTLQKSPAPSSPVVPPASGNVVQEMVPVRMFKCEHCPRVFETARARGGHRKKHRELRQARQDKIDKELRRRALAPAPAPAPSQVQVQRFHPYYIPSSSISGFVPVFIVTGAGGLPAQPAQAPANGYLGTAARGGGHLGSPRNVNQGDTAHGIHIVPSLRPSTMPMFLLQTGSGTSGLAQPSFAAPVPAAGGNGGVHLGLQQKDKPEVNQEETPDGIDLTLRL